MTDLSSLSNEDLYRYIQGGLLEAESRIGAEGTPRQLSRFKLHHAGLNHIAADLSDDDKLDAQVLRAGDDKD